MTMQNTRPGWELTDINPMIFNDELMERYLVESDGAMADYAGPENFMPYVQTMEALEAIIRYVQWDGPPASSMIYITTEILSDFGAGPITDESVKNAMRWIALYSGQPHPLFSQKRIDEIQA